METKDLKPQTRPGSQMPGKQVLTAVDTWWTLMVIQDKKRQAHAAAHVAVPPEEQLVKLVARLHGLHRVVAHASATVLQLADEQLHAGEHEGQEVRLALPRRPCQVSQQKGPSFQLSGELA